MSTPSSDGSRYDPTKIISPADINDNNAKASITGDNWVIVRLCQTTWSHDGHITVTAIDTNRVPLPGGSGPQLINYDFANVEGNEKKQALWRQVYNPPEGKTLEEPDVCTLTFWLPVEGHPDPPDLNGEGLEWEVQAQPGDRRMK